MNEAYLGNPNLKKANVQIEYTKEQVEEYLKCARDPLYFIKSYVKIINVDKGLIPFEPYSFQEKMVKTFVNNRFCINKLPRQSGKSTTVTAFMLWTVLFNDAQSVAILANKGALARDLLGKIQLAYEYLPKWLQQGVVTWNKGNIELENGSKIVAAATSSSAIRGGSYNLIFLDEFAFVGNNMAEDFFASVYPTISSGQTTKVIIVSTPNGMNHFYKMWMDAVEDRSKYVAIEVHWSEVPGRDERWKDETIANTSEEQFRQEFECEFLGSVNTLIHPLKLRTLTFKEPIRREAKLDVYEEPRSGHTYVCVADVARGAGLDYSVCSVIDITDVPYNLVAKFRCNEVSPMLYPNVIFDIATNYNKAFVLVEVNDIGGQVADILQQELEYENMLMTANRGRAGQVAGSGFGYGSFFGVRTTKAVKRIGCSTLKDLIEKDKLLITDFETIVELASFISKGTSYQAEEGQHDDLVMTLVLFAWLVRQDYFKELTDLDIRQRLYEERMKDVENNLLPFGIIDDGQDDQPIVDSTGQVWEHNLQDNIWNDPGNKW
jgi:hypothetical protein